jgi:hypothetical protein
MDPEGVRQCMSLGFSTKKSKTTIGQCKFFFYKLNSANLVVRIVHSSEGYIPTIEMRGRGGGGFIHS